MTRLLPLPCLPIRRLPLLVQREFDPVTSTLLLEELLARPIWLLTATVTLPPSEMTRLLPLPELPTTRPPLFVQSELVPVTSTLLLEELERPPMMPLLLFATVPPLEMTIAMLPLVWPT